MTDERHHVPVGLARINKYPQNAKLVRLSSGKREARSNPVDALSSLHIYDAVCGFNDVD
jgi:hypothetical protein